MKNGAISHFNFVSIESNNTYFDNENNTSKKNLSLLCNEMIFIGNLERELSFVRNQWSKPKRLLLIFDDPNDTPDTSNYIIKNNNLHFCQVRYKLLL